MNIELLDIEIINKAKESYKLLLKRKQVNIIFNPPNKDEKISESTTVSYNKHIFHLYKTYENFELMSINNRYYKFFSKKLRIKLKNLSMNKRKKLIRWKIWYTIFFVPFYGKRIRISNDLIDKFYLNYNGVVIDLTRLEYNKFSYYAKYVYKLQQLYKLNNELNIQQEFSIIFDDDKTTYNLYNEFFNTFDNVFNESMNNDLLSLDNDNEDNDLDEY